MKNVIQITDKILGVIVPIDCDILECEMWHEQDDYNKMYLQYPSDKYLGYQNYSGITLGIGNFKIHGTCTLPSFDFDFEVDESWVEKKKFNKGVFIEDTHLYRDYLSSNENMCFVGLPKYECRVKSFKSKIQKAIQDEGMFVVNPYEVSGVIDADKYNDLVEQWQSAESKTVKKLLLIEKI